MTDEKTNSGEKPKAPQWLIDNIAEASKNTRKIYLLYLGFLAYCALTAISTTDRTLVLNEPAHLPIVNVGVPLEGFFFFAPLLAIMTFVYLELYLQHLNRLKTTLRRDYDYVDSCRLYPWIVNVVDDPEPGFVGYLQKLIVNIALGWTLPIVLCIFALVYIKKHDIIMSYYLVVLPFIAMILVVSFKRKAVSMRLTELIKKRKLTFVMIIIMIMGEVFFMVKIIPLSMQGYSVRFPVLRNCVNLSYQKLVTEPETDYEGLYWADFSWAHLEGADFSSAVLKRADFTEAHLKRAYFGETNLQEANLYYADLQDADLWNANLKETDFWFANLQGASLWYANLQGAILADAKLQGADFGGANMQAADLRSANLQNARLDNVNLQEADLRIIQNLTLEQLSTTKTLFEAQLDSVLFEQVKSQYPHLLEPPDEEEDKPSP